MAGRGRIAYTPSYPCCTYSFLYLPRRPIRKGAGHRRGKEGAFSPPARALLQPPTDAAATCVRRDRRGGEFLREGGLLVCVRLLILVGASVPPAPHRCETNRAL